MRHSETKDEHARLLWQSRPLNDELVMAAAADVAYLIPLMEAQVGGGNKHGVRAGSRLGLLVEHSTSTMLGAMQASGPECVVCMCMQPPNLR